MQLGQINNYENHQKFIRKKETWKAFGYAAFFSALMLLLLMLESLFSRDIYIYTCKGIAEAVGHLISALSDMPFEDARKGVLAMLSTEVSTTIFSMVLYILTIVIPFAVFSKVVGLKLKDSLKFKSNCPKRFWLYIPFTIGAGYTINLIVNLLLKDVL
jgi:hypothetical protein